MLNVVGLPPNMQSASLQTAEIRAWNFDASDVGQVLYAVAAERSSVSNLPKEVGHVKSHTVIIIRFRGIYKPNPNFIRRTPRSLCQNDKPSFLLLLGFLLLRLHRLPPHEVAGARVQGRIYRSPCK